QVVMPLHGSANRDEQVFARGESFELMRFANTAPNHLAFGYRGAHFCLGAPLARLEANLTMQRLITRIEQIRVVPGIPLKPLLSTATSRSSSWPARPIATTSPARAPGCGTVSPAGYKPSTTGRRNAVFHHRDLAQQWRNAAAVQPAGSPGAHTLKWRERYR